MFALIVNNEVKKAWIKLTYLCLHQCDLLIFVYFSSSCIVLERKNESRSLLIVLIFVAGPLVEHDLGADVDVHSLRKRNRMAAA